MNVGTMTESWRAGGHDGEEKGHQDTRRLDGQEQRERWSERFKNTFICTDYLYLFTHFHKGDIGDHGHHVL